MKKHLKIILFSLGYVLSFAVLLLGLGEYLEWNAPSDFFAIFSEVLFIFLFNLPFAYFIIKKRKISLKEHFEHTSVVVGISILNILYATLIGLIGALGGLFFSSAYIGFKAEFTDMGSFVIFPVTALFCHALVAFLYNRKSKKLQKALFIYFIIIAAIIMYAIQ